MLTRLWFVLSLAWFLLICGLSLASGTPSASMPYALAIALAPLALGLVMRLLYRYVVFGPRMRKGGY